jgi:hypothetical protein
MPRRVKYWHSWRVKCLIVFSVIYWLASFSSAADADIQISSKSSVVILSGYSIDLEKKQELTTVGVSELLAALQGDLCDLFNANVQYLSERDLARLLEMQGIAQGSPGAIQKLFKHQKYTHLVVADVKGSESGIVDFQVANLVSDGSVQEMRLVQTVKLSTTTTPRQLDVARDQVVRGFRGFAGVRDVDAPRTVLISCILPRSPPDRDDIANIERTIWPKRDECAFQFLSIRKNARTVSAGG